MIKELLQAFSFPKKNPTLLKIRLHVFILGLIYTTLISLGIKHNLIFLDIAGGLAILHIMSLLSNFCPIYFLLNILIKNGEKIMDGSQD